MDGGEEHLVSKMTATLAYEGSALTRPDDAATMAGMLLTILKIVAGLAVLSIISLVLVAVISGLAHLIRALRKPEDRDE